ncbi:TonB-dependent receptor [Chitinimonas sp. BJYL2]|uniref:TonB-dependent receptor n=1 Tax=Chitinimonas sp. BJYL2 TaxID=2976696 RepID=UPI0022B5243D|nr:TonB-dependent receptor [Chitinimonas sp. BJYL2]
MTTEEQAALPAQLDTVTVSATRRPEPLQKVPVAVTVLKGRDLERANRNDLGAMVEVVPAASFRTNASSKDTSLFIRGVGTVSTSPGVEPTVSTMVDGVVFGRPGQTLFDLMDIERVEVLRGPQGTLFGKNASAGVIHITTRIPSETPEGYVNLASYGDGPEQRVRAGWSGPLGESLTGSLTVSSADQRGNLDNLATGRRVNGVERRGGRVRLRYAPGGDWYLDLSADLARNRGEAPPGVVVATRLIAYPGGEETRFPAFAAALAPVVADARNRQVNADLDSSTEDRHQGLSLQLEGRWREHTVNAISAWRRWQSHQIQDNDRLPRAYPGLPQQHDDGRVDYRQVSQELRLASAKGGHLDYVAGFYLLHGRDDETYRRDVRRAGPPPQDDYGQARFGIRNTSTAVFGEGTLHLHADTRALAGLRWTEERLDFHHRRYSSSATALPGVNPSVANTGATRDRALSGRLGVQQDLGPRWMAYATWSRGYKGPAFNVFFNMQDRDTLALKPELSDSYELGTKYQAPGQRLRANLAVFKTDYDNFQANFPDLLAGVVVTRLVNAGKVTTRGVELDASFKPGADSWINLALARIQARVAHFNCPPGAAVSCNVDGKPLPFSPDWKLNLQLGRGVALSGGWRIETALDYRWQSKVQYDISQFPDTIQPAYGVVDASVAVSSSARGWRAALLAKNLGDKSYANFLTRSGVGVMRFVPRDDRRYIGLDLRYAY